MSQNSFTIRHMTDQEVSLAVNWAAEEGWNPGINDAGCFWCADRQGFLIGLAGDLPVGCISAVKYGSDYGFIGFYIVRPEWRGQGYGLQLWQAAMDQLADRVVGLDGVVAQQNNYQKSGFKFAYNNIRFSGFFHDLIEGHIADLGAYPGIVPVSKVSLEELLDYDRALFSTGRQEFLPGWLSQQDAFALAVTGGNRLLGYGVIRKCRQGWKIGPLFANDTEAAEKLLLSLTVRAKGEEVLLDVPEVNAAALALAAKYKMTKVFETAHMYKGHAPLVALEKIFGVTTFELG